VRYVIRELAVGYIFERFRPASEVKGRQTLCGKADGWGGEGGGFKDEAGVASQVIQGMGS